jgi:hypothetical protein
MNPPHRGLIAHGIVVLSAAALLAACVEGRHSGPALADTGLEFQELTNLGYACGGPLTSWTVTDRQTSDQGTAGCEQPVLFVGLTPNTTYTFDIQGYAGEALCWKGTCDAVAQAYTTTLVDCSAQIEHLCGM